MLYYGRNYEISLITQSMLALKY